MSYMTWCGSFFFMEFVIIYRDCWRLLRAGSIYCLNWVIKVLYHAIKLACCNDNFSVLDSSVKYQIKAYLCYHSDMTVLNLTFPFDLFHIFKTIYKWIYISIKHVFFCIKNCANLFVVWIKDAYFLKIQLFCHQNKNNLRFGVNARLGIMIKLFLNIITIVLLYYNTYYIN